MSSRTRRKTIDRVWTDLQSDLVLLYRDATISTEAHMRCYNAFYGLCIPHAATRKRRASFNSAADSSPEASFDFIGWEIYRKLENFLNGVIDDIRKELESIGDGDELLKRYADAWDGFVFSSKIADGIFRYLNDHWVPRQRVASGIIVYPVHLLCLQLWKPRILDEFAEELARAAVNLITRARNGESVEDAILKKFVRSLEDLEVTLAGEPSKHARLYVDYFEWRFLEATNVFYREEANAIMQEGDVVKFTINAEKRFHEEEDRVRRCLSAFSAPRIAYILEEVFVWNHLLRMNEEFERFLSEDRDEDVRRTHRLCARVAGGLDQLCSTFQRFVTRKGEEAVNRLLMSGGDIDPSPNEYVKALLKIHKRYAHLVKDIDFGRAFDEACVVFVNANAVTRRGKTNRSAEFLARHIDSLLRKGGQREDLDDAVVIFKYLTDKESFQKFYTTMLSKRLIAKTTIDEESEVNVIAMLKDVAGFDYTSRFHRMFSDMLVSKGLNVDFQQVNEGKFDDFSAMVLCSAFWPFKETLHLSLPPILHQSINKFESFYASKHRGRKLMWILDVSLAEVRTNSFSRSYSLSTTALQMAILLKYNEASKFKVGTLKKELNTSEETFVAVLQSLVNVNLLKLPKGKTVVDALTDNVQVKLNSRFESTKQRIDLARYVKAPKIEKQAETEKVERTLVKDQKLSIQASIVRVMKTQRTMKHVDLVAAVIDQLSVRFLPEIASIKENIEDLIEKDYLKRIEGDRKSYKFIA